MRAPTSNLTLETAIDPYDDLVVTLLHLRQNGELPVREEAGEGSGPLFDAIVSCLSGDRGDDIRLRALLYAALM